MLLHVLKVRQVRVSEETRERILSCSDSGMLYQWAERALTASSAEELFANT